MPHFNNDMIDISMSPDSGGVGLRAILGRTNTGIMLTGSGQGIFCDCHLSVAPDAPPVFQVQAGSGVGLQISSDTNAAVRAVSRTNAALLGESTSGTGVTGRSDAAEGIAGSTNSNSRNAIFGLNGAHGAVPSGLSTPAGCGVWGHTTVEKGSGIFGSVEPGLAQAAGVVGVGAIAGRFFGKVEVNGNVSVTGDIVADNSITVAGDIFLPQRGDIAERFAVSPGAEKQPGS